MHKPLPLFILLLAAALLPLSAMAKKGAPHTFEAKAVYSKVEMSWKAPNEAKQLMWHNGRDYDGDAGKATSPQHPAVIYIAADFASSNLTPGDIITSVNYFEYRPIIGLTAIIWEDGKIVRTAKGDLSGFKANQWRTVTFNEPYTIPEGKNIRVGFKLEHGTNLDFVAIMDNACDKRGDLRSYDGKTWEHNGRGTYLITVNLKNDVDEAPTGYSVYSGGTLVVDNLQATDFVLRNQPEGTRVYRVEAEYGSERYGTDKTLTTKPASQAMPGPRFVRVDGSGANGFNPRWMAPLMRTSDNLLTWHAPTDTLANSIGGTASSNTKVWIKNEFAASDLLSFANAKITGIRAQFHEKTVKSIIAWVMKDGAFVQYDTIAQSIIDGITPDTWVTLPLKQPVEIEPGSKYAYGYYMMHTPKTHPVSVNGAKAVGKKANSFSTSSPNSSNFAKSNPSWRTLAEGDIPGNWMLAAELEAGPADLRQIKSYNIYLDGVLQGNASADQTLTNGMYFYHAFAASKPGPYTMGVQTVSSDNITSDIVESTIVIGHNSYNVAPTISNAEFVKETGKVSFDITMDRQLQHYGEAAYKAGFDEEITLNWGARFTPEQLESYYSWRITKINFVIGQSIPAGFKLQLHKANGTQIASYDIGADQVSPLGMYSLTLDDDYTIIPEDGLYLSYQATLPAKCSAMVLDNGPLVDGGAVVKLPGTSSWLNLGTINATYNKYNIVIGATCSQPRLVGSPAQTKELGSTGIIGNPACIELKASELRNGLGVEASMPVRYATTRQGGTGQPFDPKCFYIYRNGEKIATTEENKFADVVSDHDIFTYEVSGLYDREWESPKSSPLIVDNGVAQAGPAPYNLHLAGTEKLAWEAPQAAPVLTYCTASPTSYGVGMTGGTTRTTYAMQKFPADSISKHAGDLVSHIRFGLYSTNLTYASVVVIKDLNILYEQEVKVSDLNKIQDGWNEIRLNEPVALEAGHEYMFGYRLDYLTGEKPMLFDAGPATDKFGNLISASASHTSWKSLKSLNKSLDGNWRIYTTLMRPGMERTGAHRAEGLTYNVYRNGEKVYEGITATEAPAAWMHGMNVFTVTAVKNGVESAPSNEVRYNNNGVNITDATAAIYYDAATATLVTEEEGMLYDTAGRSVMPIPARNTALSALGAGTYIFRTVSGKTLKLVK